MFRCSSKLILSLLSALSEHDKLTVDRIRRGNKSSFYGFADSSFHHLSVSSNSTDRQYR